MLDGTVAFDPTPTECAPADAPVRTWTVTLSTPHGEGQLDVPTALGPYAAGRRAVAAAWALGWGDVDEVTVAVVTLA